MFQSHSLQERANIFRIGAIDPGQRFLYLRIRLAAWMAVHAFSWVLVLYIIFVLATWLPGYLAWPLWADHDVFAVLAQGWSAGEQPYRDRPTTNFPGPIYQAWVLGKLFGWGKPHMVYAFDALLMLALCAGCVVWSRKNYGWWLPGLIAAAGILSYHSTHDFAHAAQRDGQATAFMLLAFLLANGAKPSVHRLLPAAFLVAFALISRPQTVLFLPALAWALSNHGWRRLVLGISFSLMFFGLLLLPLLLNGLLTDWLLEINRIGTGGIYAQAKFDLNRIFLDQLLTGGCLPILMLGGFALAVQPKRPFIPVLLLACIALYRPLSPFPHGYLDQPFRLSLAFVSMFLAARIIETEWRPRWKSLLLLALITSVIEPFPRCCESRKLGKSWKYLTTGNSHRYVPIGYTKESIPGQHIYPWHEYKALIDYLRTQTPPDAPIANLLLAPTAINGATGRHTPLHAESMMWLIIVGRPDHEAFADELRSASDAYVVWRPAEWHLVPEWRCLPETIELYYKPVANFGDIVVCRKSIRDERPTSK